MTKIKKRLGKNLVFSSINSDDITKREKQSSQTVTFKNLCVINETEKDYSKRVTNYIETEILQLNGINLEPIRNLDETPKKNYYNSSINIAEKTNDENDKIKIAVKFLKNNKKTKKNVVIDLYDVIGLISVDLIIEDLSSSKYQPWNVVSLTESKVINYYKTKKQKLIQFSSNSFLRVYPAGSRIDSSNFDPTKSWICGGQLVSLNLQSLSDDYTLLNHLFYKINTGKGYILKPSYLRSGSFLNRDYFSASFTLEFELLSGIMLQKCMKPESNELHATVNVIGTFEDDKNPCFKTGTVNENFFNPSFINGKIKFSIHEENLSFLLIKIIDNCKQVLARSVVPMMTLLEGYRNILLYDDNCHEIENCIIIVRVKKILSNNI